MTMTDEKYGQQLQAGITIVMQTLEKLANGLNKPQVKRFSLRETEQDFARDQVSLSDPAQRMVVTKFLVDDLADAPSSTNIGTDLRRNWQYVLLRGQGLRFHGAAASGKYVEAFSD
jgi:hypothetical protein